MAEIQDWRTDADQNNDAPPDGAPEGMSRGSVNNTMREMMAVVRRWYQSISGELLATATTGAAYTISPAQTYSAYATGMIFTFRVPMDCLDDCTLTVGSLAAVTLKKVTSTGSVNLEATDMLEDGVYTAVYVTSIGFIVTSGIGSKALTNANLPATLTRSLQPSGAGFVMTKITVSDDAPVSANLQNGEIYYQY